MLIYLPQNGKTSLHMASYAGGKLVEHLQMIIDTLGEQGDTLNICATGIGSNLHKQKLEEELNIRYKI